MNHLAEIAGAWDIFPGKIRDDLEIAGSPERCEERLAFEDRGKRLFILERIFPSSVPHRKRLSGILARLQEQGVKHINPYLLNGNGEFITKHEDGYWQLSVFVEGTDLARPDYAADGWRGVAMADFLKALRTASSEMPLYLQEKPFSIIEYIRDFSSTVSRYEPLLHESLLPVMSFLDGNFTRAHDKLPLAFNHGDFHPLNVIWGPDSIRAVIDWEFAGRKPEIYDIALLVGCIGIEDPEALFGEMTSRFINTVRDGGYISDISWDNLLEFVVAVRFAWMAEWLRKCDGEMIELELAYLNLLVKYAGLLRNEWQQVGC